MQGDTTGDDRLEHPSVPAPRGAWLPASATVNPHELHVGMDVVGSDGEPVGRIKDIQAPAFLVDRPGQRDVYVPLSAVLAIETDEQQIEFGPYVLLEVSSSSVDLMGWPSPPL